MSNTAFINRSLQGVRNELEFLKDSGVITERFYNEINQRLPQRHTDGAAPVDLVVNGGEQKAPQAASAAAPAPAAVPAPPASAPPASRPSNKDVVEAVYDYERRDPTDLRLARGARVEVLERMNQDWWRGKDLKSGEEGIFPSNYVKPATDDHSGPASPPPYEKRGVQGGYNAPSGPPQGPPQGYQQEYNQYPPQSAPPQPSYQSQAGYSAYPPPSTNYYPPPMQQQQQIAPAQEQPQQPHQPGTLHKLGSKFGNAAIFGAGATVGSDIINSIF